MDLDVTLQGEGKNIGTPIILARQYGCNLHCPFCDTAYAIKEKKLRDIDDILKNIELLLNQNPNINTIVFTGGEPFIDRHINQIYTIIKTMSSQLKNIEIETNGTLLNNLKIFDDTIIHSKNITLNISPKLEISCFKGKIYSEIENIYINSFLSIKNRMDFNDINYIVKFVYDYTLDYDNMEELKIYKFLIQNNILKENVMIMPFTPNIKSDGFNKKFQDSCQETVKFCIKNGFRYSPREHINLNII
jgi:organic radical activating enzyme